MRLIDADAMKDRVKNYMSVFDKKDWRGICEMLNNAPTIEAEPIRHGRWIYKEYGYPTAIAFYKCSVCGSTRGFDIDNYCPHCGAKMDEEEKQ